MRSDIYYLKEALKEAKKAYTNDDVPVGCVIVVDDKIVARAYNKRNLKANALLHAEIIAIDKACKKLKRWILDDATLYVTLEPCLMCSGAIIQSRIKRVVFGASEPKSGCSGSILNILEENNFNHQVKVTKSILENEVSKMMKSFFKDLRSRRK